MTKPNGVVEIVLEHLSVLHVEPGDVLVLRYPGILSDDAIHHLHESFRNVFGEGMKVIVLDQGMELSVARLELP